MLKATGSSVKKRDHSIIVTTPKKAGMAETSFQFSSVAYSAGSVGSSRPSMKVRTKPLVMTMFVSMPYWAILCGGKVSQIDLPMIRQEQLPTKPRMKRPMQSRGRFLKQVNMDPTTAILYVSKVVRLLPYTISLPPTRLPKPSPATAIVPINEFQNVNSSSVQLKND